MILDGLDGKVQRPGNELVRLAAQQERKHFGLARGEAERGERCRRALAVALLVPGHVAARAGRLARRAGHAHDRGRKVDAALEHKAQRVRQRLVAGALRNETHGAEVDRPHDVVPVVGGGDDDDGNRRMATPELRQQVEAVVGSELEIEQHNVDVRFGGEGLPRRLGCPDGDDLDIPVQALHQCLEG